MWNINCGLNLLIFGTLKVRSFLPISFSLNPSCYCWGSKWKNSLMSKKKKQEWRRFPLSVWPDGGKPFINKSNSNMLSKHSQIQSSSSSQSLKSFPPNMLHHGVSVHARQTVWPNWNVWKSVLPALSSDVIVWCINCSFTSALGGFPPFPFINSS